MISHVFRHPKFWKVSIVSMIWRSDCVVSSVWSLFHKLVVIIDWFIELSVVFDILLWLVRGQRLWMQRISHLFRHLDPILERRRSWSSFRADIKAHWPYWFETIQRINARVLIGWSYQVFVEGMKLHTHESVSRVVVGLSDVFVVFLHVSFL